MKMKRYRVKVKLVFETTMEHSQTSMKKAQEDVNRLVNDYLNNEKLNITKLFDEKPRVIYKVEKKNGKL